MEKTTPFETAKVDVGVIRKTGLTRVTTIALAAAATATSLGVAAYSGWERGGTCLERVTYTALAVVIASGVHLLPAVSQQRPLIARIAVSVLCAAGLAVTLSSQISFFQLAQQHAGARRAESVPQTARVLLPDTPARSLTAIAHDQASARKTLALIDSHRCDGNCTNEHLRRATLTATLDALEIEADEARRREAAEDRQVVLVDRTLQLRDAMRDDPVTVRLADLTGLGKTSVSLLLSLVYACVLDGIGVFGWYLALPARRRGGDAMTAVVVATNSGVERKHVEADKAVDTDDSRMTSCSPDGEFDTQLMQLKRDISEGKVQATVAAIRNYLGCSQATALKLRRGLQGPLAAACQSNGGSHVR